MNYRTDERTSIFKSKRLAAPLVAIAIIAFSGMLSCAQPAPTKAPPLLPIDPQVCQDQQDMTWEDYRPIPGVDWADASHAPKKGFRMALVAVDFPDQPFVITLQIL